MSNQGVVAELRIFTEESPKGVQKEQVKCVKDVGIEGDKYAKGGERQVTLQDQTVKEWIDFLLIPWYYNHIKRVLPETVSPKMVSQESDFAFGKAVTFCDLCSLVISL